MIVIIKNCEFRGYEERVSANDVRYGLIFFEQKNDKQNYIAYKLIFKDNRLFDDVKDLKRGEYYDFEAKFEKNGQYSNFEITNIYPEGLDLK